MYAKNTKTKGDKFEVRGRMSIFIGYPLGQKGYHFYDIKDKNFIMLRDVRFVENEFLFKALDS